MQQAATSQIDIDLKDSPDSPGPDDAADFRNVRCDHPEQASAGPSDASGDEVHAFRRSRRSSQGRRPPRLQDSEDEAQQPAWQPEPAAAAAAAGTDEAVSMSCDEEEEDVVSGWPSGACVELEACCLRAGLDCLLPWQFIVGSSEP